jgi:TolA-binding protein
MTRDLPTASKDGDPEDEVVAALFRARTADHLAGPPCPAPELVQASQMGTLPAPLQERIARHLGGCVVCQALVEALEDPAVARFTPEDSTRILTRLRADAGRSRRMIFAWWQLPAAAAVVALVGLAVALNRESTSLPGPPAPGEIAAGAPSVFQLDKPEFRAGASSDLVWRGPADSAAPTELDRALEPYHAGDFAEAARSLTALLDRQPQNATAHFYLGLSDLSRGSDAEAVTALEGAERTVQGDAELARETAWYLALAYRRTGQIQRAGAKLEALCRGGSSRAARACIGLSELSKASSVPQSR